MWANLVGAIVSGLVSFFATRGASIFAGLGLTFIGVKGFETFLGFIVSDFNAVVSTLSSGPGGGGSGGAYDFAVVMIQVAAYAGFFDALNILISGWMAFASLLGVRFVLARLAR